MLPTLNVWSRGQDLNLRPSGYEPDELPDCSTPQYVMRFKHKKELYTASLDPSRMWRKLHIWVRWAACAIPERATVAWCFSPMGRYRLPMAWQFSKLGIANPCYEI